MAVGGKAEQVSGWFGLERGKMAELKDSGRVFLMLEHEAPGVWAESGIRFPISLES